MAKNDRRTFLRHGSHLALGLGLAGISGYLSACGGPDSRGLEDGQGEVDPGTPLWFDISLAEWSLNGALFGGQLDNLEFPGTAKNTYGVEAVEWVNQFFKDKAEDMGYLDQMKQRCDEHGVRSLLIMIDGEGNLGSTNETDRLQAVENHYTWVDAAKYLGCHSIRVNAAGEGSAEEVRSAAIDGLGRLSEYASSVGLNVLVENHGGYSSNGQWLASVMQGVGMDNCGTLPDFGNFCLRPDDNGCAEEYDRYQGVSELMPYAKAVSAKTHDFDAEGNETHTDYYRMMEIVKNAGYTGYVGIEYEGRNMPAEAGIKATKALLERVGRQLAS